MSMLTVNIYMNGGFEGGSTRFYFEGDKKASFAVTPSPGLCLLFRQPPGEAYYHDGEMLGSGVKYLFRSDVMYRRLTSASQSANESVASGTDSDSGSKIPQLS